MEQRVPCTVGKSVAWGVLVLVTALSAPSGWAQPPADSHPGSPAPANPLLSSASLGLPWPSSFAPLPFPHSTAAAESQEAIASLLRNLEGVAAADVLIAGDTPETLSARVLIKRRPGRPLAAEQVQTMANLVNEAVPGLQASRLIIADSAGRTLYANEQVVREALVSGNARQMWLWLALGVLVLVLVGVAIGLAAWRRPRVGESEASLSFIAGLREADLVALLDGEALGLVPLLAAVGGPRVARRLQRLARREGRSWLPPGPTVDPEVARAVARAVRAKAADLGRR
jgi:hypothetical protein